MTVPDVASLDGLLSWWENAEYVAEAFGILGCAGEFTAEFTNVRTPEWRHQLSKLSLLVLITALAFELGALARTNSLSGQEIALLNGVAADARTRAANAEATAKGFDSKIAEAQRGTSEAQRDAEIAKKNASESDERAAANEKEAALLAKAAEDERLARAKIETRLAPRRVSSEQAKQLCLFVRVTGDHTIEIGSSFGTPEADDFAEDIARALMACGFSVTLTKSAFILPVPRPLRMNFGPNRRQDAENIDAALLKAGITTKAIERGPVPDHSPDALRLFVGPKPN